MSGWVSAPVVPAPAKFCWKASSAATLLGTPPAKLASEVKGYEPPKKPGKKLRMLSRLKSAPPLKVCAPRDQVRVSATWKRLMVVSRGLKLLRPKVSTRWPLWLTSVSGDVGVGKPRLLVLRHTARAPR